MRSPQVVGNTSSLPVREAPKPPAQEPAAAPPKSPPKEPAALRAPPTGPAAARNFPATAASTTTTTTTTVQPSRFPQAPSGLSARPDPTTPTVPPSGPRGYVPPRGGGFGRGGRGGWSGMTPQRHVSGSAASPPIAPSGPSGIPTGPRAVSTASAAVSPPVGPKNFNPPTGPASHNPPARQSLAQNLISNMPPIIPGGKLDQSSTVLTTGVVKELQPHHSKLKEEEERNREELKMKQEKLRKSLRMWERLERESKAFELKSDLSEKSLKNLAGEGLGGAAF